MISISISLLIFASALAIVLASSQNQIDTASRARDILDKKGWEDLDEFMSSRGYLHRSSSKTILWFKEGEGDAPIAITTYKDDRACLVDPEKEFEILREAGFFTDDEDSNVGGNPKIKTGSQEGSLITDLIGLIDPLPAVSAVHKSYYWLSITCTCYDQNPENGRVTIVGYRQWSKEVSYPRDDDGMWVTWNNDYSHLYSHSSDGEVAEAQSGGITFYIDDHDLSGTTAVCIAPNSEDSWGKSATGFYGYHHNWGLWGSFTIGISAGSPYVSIDLSWTGSNYNEWKKTEYDEYTIGG